jgi:hypothetical protein
MYPMTNQAEREARAAEALAVLKSLDGTEPYYHAVHEAHRAAFQAAYSHPDYLESLRRAS